MKVYVISVKTEEEDNWVWRIASTYDLAKMLIQRRGEEGIGDKYMLNYEETDFDIEEFDIDESIPVDLRKVS